MAHKKVVCSCGRVISNCRCIGPKEVVVSPDPCTHNQKPLSATLMAADAATANASAMATASHPATTGVNLREENEFLINRLRMVAMQIGQQIDPRTFTRDEWASALHWFAVKQRNIGARRAMDEALEELERYYAEHPSENRQHVIGIIRRHITRSGGK